MEEGKEGETGRQPTIRQEPAQRSLCAPERPPDLFRYTSSLRNASVDEAKNPAAMAS